MFNIRLMTASDLIEIIQIESEVQAYPWTEKMFKDCLTEQYESFILEENNELCGYLITQTIIDECHILTLGVKKNKQRKNFATQLLQFFIAHQSKTCCRILLEVAETNEAAIHLYKKLGFEFITLRKNYYQNSLQNKFENALVFEKKTAK